MMRDLVPASVRHGLRRLATRVRVRKELLEPWRWRARRFKFSSYDVITFCTPENRLARELLGLEGEGEPCSFFDANAPNVALVTPMIVPGSLRVPCDVHTVVPLGRELEDILKRYDRELRRSLKKQRARYKLQHAAEPRIVEQLNREMLVPYARARHGDLAVCPSLDEVRAIALGEGRLDAVADGAAPVACHLGYPLARDGGRHWITLRFGYPEGVFGDAKRLREVNSINTYLALEWALEHGFDAYDMGSASSRPHDGLLQWKRRRDGAVDAFHTEEWLSVRLPRAAPDAFLWDHPLFAASRSGLELWLGVPCDADEDEALQRHHELGFSGLDTVHVQSGTLLTEPLEQGLRAVFASPTHPARRFIVHTAG